MIKKRKYDASSIFTKRIKKLKGSDLSNLFNKLDEILSCEDIDHYKNLRHPLNKFKRVHINKSFVILFFGNDGSVYFVNYLHHDIVYKNANKTLEKYSDLFFDE